MARIRTIKPEFWTNEALSSLPEATHMLAAALLNYADDEGYFNANPALVRAACAPLREPSVSVHNSLISLQKVGFLKIGQVKDGRKYGHITSFLKHQRVNRASPSRIKSLEIVWEESVIDHTQFSEDSLPEGNREQGTGNGTGKGERGRARRKKFSRPTVEQVAAYCAERANGIDAQRFVSYYEARGWMLGKTKIKSWKACIQTWERNGEQNGSSGNTTCQPLTDEELDSLNVGGGE